MKTILLAFNTNYPCKAAASVANDLAQRLSVRLISVQVTDTQPSVKTTKALAIAGARDEKAVTTEAGISQPGAYHCLKSNQLPEFLIREEVFLVVADDAFDCAARILHYGWCPVLLVPSAYLFNGFHRINYIADIRYCQPAIVNQLNRLAAACQAKLALSHISLNDIPHPSEEYIKMLFDELTNLSKGEQAVQLNHIRERNVGKALDVLIHAMGCDMAVLVNRQFHFDELSSAGSVNTLVRSLDIPVLVFPG